MPKFGFMFQHLSSPFKFLSSLMKFKELGVKNPKETSNFK